jgi:hypothetical protein
MTDAKISTLGTLPRVSLINELRVAEDMIEKNPQKRCLGYARGST